MSHTNLLGNYVRCYIGYSNDERIRWHGSSGGLVTSILIFALEQGFIDGAVVTRMSRTNPLVPETFIARSKDEILSARGSKYCPVPVKQVRKAMEEITSQRGKYAVVGLPCHMRAIRKAESLDERLKDRILLHIGLFCSHTVNFSGTKVLLKRIGVRPEDVLEFRYRGGGWPGNLSVTLKDGSLRSCPFFDYWGTLFTSFFFTPRSCMFCSDALNELADISLGDAWLPELKRKDKVGTSVVISRTFLGEETLRRAREIIQLHKISVKDVVRSQWAGLFFKKKSLQIRKHILLKRMSSKEVFSSIRSNPLILLCATLQLLGMKLSENKGFQSLLVYIPHKLLKLYSIIVGGFQYLSWCTEEKECLEFTS